MGQIKIATLGTPHDYKSLIPTIINYLGWNISWSTPRSCDLLVLGSFHKTKKSLRFLPKKSRNPSLKLMSIQSFELRLKVSRLADIISYKRMPKA